MLSALLISGTERVLLVLGWDHEINTATHRTPHTQNNPSCTQFKRKTLNKDTTMFGQQPTLRPMVGVNHTTSQHQQTQAWTNASAFDAAPSGTV